MPKRVDHIRLVESSPALHNTRDVAAQGTLFQLPSKHLLVFLGISSITDSMFLNILNGGMLRVFDLRVAPRFDIGQLTRSRVFELFNKHRIEYFDIPGSLSVLSTYDVRLNPESVAPFVFSKIRDHKMPGPNLFLLDDDKRAAEFALLLPRSLPAPAKRGWEILIPNQNPFTETLFAVSSKDPKKGRYRRADKAKA